uniref:CheW protein n=1 Tax=Cyanothece sp. (strain PCC 7425 / ATCC 29141) TaxID=395961 RepID=B8HY10_CYAP4
MTTSVLLRSTQDSTEPYLKLQLQEGMIVALSMLQIQEVLAVERRRITPIPNRPNFLLGLINQRNRVFWVADLALLLNLSPLDWETELYNVVVLRAEQGLLGLAVQQVKGISRFSAEQLQSPVAAVPAELTPYLRGCVLQPPEIILVLSVETLAQSPSLPAQTSP